MSSTLSRPTKSRPPDDNLEVVFIGDVLGLAELYRLKLELDGYWVTTYSTVDDGLKHIRTRMPDLLFLDLGADGRRLSEDLVMLRSDVSIHELPIVLLSRGDIRWQLDLERVSRTLDGEELFLLAKQGNDIDQLLP